MLISSVFSYRPEECLCKECALQHLHISSTKCSVATARVSFKPSAVAYERVLLKTTEGYKTTCSVVVVSRGWQKPCSASSAPLQMRWGLTCHKHWQSIWPNIIEVFFFLHLQLYLLTVELLCSQSVEVLIRRTFPL